MQEHHSVGACAVVHVQLLRANDYLKFNINMAADGELTQRLGEHSQIIAFANEIIDIVISSDLQQEAVKSADAVEKVKCKVSKSKESVLESIQGIPEKYLKSL